MYRNIWRKTINLWPLSALKVDEVPDCWQVLHDILQYSSATQPPIHSVPCHFGKHQSEKNNTQQFWKHRLNSLTHKGATGDLCQYLKLWQQFTRSNHNRTLCLGNAVDNRLFTECCIQCHNYKAKQVVTVIWRKATSYSPGCTNVHPSSTPQSASAPYWWWPCWVPSSISTAGHFQACPGPATSPPSKLPFVCRDLDPSNTFRWAHPSQHCTQHFDRFSHFCTANYRVSLYFTIGCPFPRQSCLFLCLVHGSLDHPSAQPKLFTTVTDQ